MKKNKRYHSGLSKSTSAKRHAQFKKQSKMHWDNPEAYKKAPGDSKETKTSKYTLRMKKKYPSLYKEEHGAGFEGTDELVKKYKKDTPGENPKRRFKITESADTSLKKKAKASGISVGILKQVYNRGVAAWRTGHRPGTTPEQWGHARVNSFMTGGKTRRTADKDLWAKHKGNE